MKALPSQTDPLAEARRLVLTDIDGTLLDDGGELPARNREALLACREAGVTVAVATGRRWTTTRRLFDRLDLWPDIDYAILNNGMVIQDLVSRKVLLAQAFELEQARQIADALAGMQMEPILLSHSQDGAAPDVHYRAVSLMNGDFIEKNQGQSRRIDSFDVLRDETLVEILLVGRHEDLARAQLSLAAHSVETALIKNSFYKEWMLEVTPRGISKFSGAVFLQAHVGATPASSLAIGDSANDMPLLRAAGHAVAMAHAPEALKQAAQAVAGPNDAGGMGQAVFDWLRGGAPGPGAAKPAP